MFAERNRDGAELIARGAVEVHVPRGAEGVRGDRAEKTVFGTELVRELAVRPRLVAQIGFLRGVRARPRIPPEADDDGRRHAGLDRHGGERDAENLAGAAIVERGGEACIDAEPRADQLMMRIALVRAAADDAVDVGDLQAGIDDGIVHRLDQKIEARYAGHPAQAAVASPDNGANVAQLA